MWLHHRFGWISLQSACFPKAKIKIQQAFNKGLYGHSVSYAMTNGTHPEKDKSAPQLHSKMATGVWALSIWTYHFITAGTTLSIIIRKLSLKRMHQCIKEFALNINHDVTSISIAWLDSASFTSGPIPAYMGALESWSTWGVSPLGSEKCNWLLRTLNKHYHSIL